MSTLRSFSLILLAVCSCADTGGDFAEVPIAARGTAPTPFVKSGWEVTLTEATVGFGPLYFCTTESALSSRCEVAILELLEGVTIDGLDPSPQAMGALQGTTGTIRTAFFDYGITWLLTSPVPEALDGVPGGPADVPFESPNYVPRGHSSRFRGTAVCVEDAATCCPGSSDCPDGYEFEALVDVVVVNPGTPAVNGVRTSQEITSEPVTATVELDPTLWWQSVSFARLAELDDGSGLVTVDPEGPDYSAIVAAMTANQLPSFVWTTELTR